MGLRMMIVPPANDISGVVVRENSYSQDNQGRHHNTENGSHFPISNKLSGREQAKNTSPATITS